MAAPAFVAPVFAALGDPVRLAIVTQLCASGPLPTMRLKERTEISRQAITKHLRILEEAGLVHSDRVGRDRAWRIEPHQLTRTRDYLARISAQWDARIERLRAFVEDTED
jgi:DNA-binding transcriptional ArsR family regulator